MTFKKVSYALLLQNDGKSMKTQTKNLKLLRGAEKLSKELNFLIKVKSTKPNLHRARGPYSFTK